MSTGNNDGGTNAADNSSSSSNNETLVIALSTVLSVVGVVGIVVAAYYCTRRWQRRISLFNRGITTIGDDEIATWKVSRVSRASEKETDRYTRRPVHTPNASGSTRKAPSLIQYQNGGRPSLDAAASPRSFINNKYSMDMPRTPEGAVLARAPNARSGLTDETVPGADPFVPSPKRHPSRLYKLPPNSPNGHNRRKGSRSSSIRSFREAWNSGPETSPRGSHDNPGGHERIYSSSSIPPRLSFGEEQFTGLSPPPSRRNDVIGQAFG